MEDTYHYYVYENQRWNPFGGYTTHGLPTDRPMWSDETGCEKKSFETTKLPNRHWQWVSYFWSVLRCADPPRKLRCF